MPFSALRGLWIGLCVVMAFGAQPAFGQTPGTRASGMAEAFVAVADDATAIYWNPAGMATGAFLSFVLDYGRGDQVPELLDPGGKQSATFIGFTLPPFGFGYYRLNRLVTVPETPEETAQPSREDGRQSVQGLTTSHVGVTLGQSLGRYVVVAGTVKYVQGEVTAGTFVGTPEDALEAADGFPTESTSRVDVDAGAMLAVEQWRVGLQARNLTAPSFHVPALEGGEVELDRAFRVGLAWGAGWPGMTNLVVSADADLTRKPALTGERRDVAAGIETWWLRQRLGVRGGVRGSTVGGARTVVAGGVSAAIKAGVFVEAHLARGDQDGQSWSVGARLTY
jgi:F plasmid transfer operon, TraF, protein